VRITLEGGIADLAFPLIFFRRERKGGEPWQKGLFPFKEGRWGGKTIGKRERKKGDTYLYFLPYGGDKGKGAKGPEEREARRVVTDKKEGGE